MENPDVIQQAKDHITGLIRQDEGIHKALPFLDSINQQLNWYQKVYELLPDWQDELMTVIRGPIKEICNWEYSKFNTGMASGALATLLTASTYAVSMISTSPKSFHYLVRENEKLSPVKAQMNQILKVLLFIDDKLYRHFEEVLDCYKRWNNKHKSNSELCKDTYVFHQHFVECLNRLRVPKQFEKTEKALPLNWEKMAGVIGRKSLENQKALMAQEKISEDVWNLLEPVSAESIQISRERIDMTFKKYIAHVYAVLNLIDDNVLH